MAIDARQMLDQFRQEKQPEKTPAPDARSMLESYRSQAQPETLVETPEDPLSAESLSLRDYASGRGSQFLSAMSGAGAGLLETIYDYSPPGQMYRVAGREYNKPGVESMREFSKDMGDAAHFQRPEHPALKWVTDVIDGTLQMAPSVTATMITKKPNLGLEIMGSQVFGQTYNEEVSNGASPDEAAIKAMRATAYEIGPEKIFGFFDRLGVTGGVKKYLTQVVAEAGSEYVTEALTIGDETIIEGEEFKGWVDFLKRTGYAASIGAGMGAGLSLGSLQRGREQTEKETDPGAIAEENDLETIVRETLAKETEKEQLNLRQEEQAEIDKARQKKESVLPEEAGEQLPVQELEPEVIPEPPVAKEVIAEQAEVQKPVKEPEPEKIAEPPVAEEVEDAGEQLPVETEPETVQEKSIPESDKPKITRALKKTNFEAYENEDGTWYVRTRTSKNADWETKIRDKLNTNGLKKITAKMDSGRVRIDGKYYQIQEPGLVKGTTEKTTNHLLSDLAKAGGINPADFESEFKQKRFGKDWLKRKTGGMNREGLLEWMRENDYLPEDSIDLYDATEKLEQAMFDYDDSRTVTPRLSDVDAAVEAAAEERFASETERIAAIENELNKEFSDYEGYTPELAEAAHDFYQEAYDEYAKEIIPGSETADPNAGAAGRKGRKKQIRPSDEAQEALPIEGEKDSDKLHNLAEEKEAKRKGLDKPFVAPEEGPGGLFEKDDSPVPGEADVRNQTEFENAAPTLSEEKKNELITFQNEQLDGFEKSFGREEAEHKATMMLAGIAGGPGFNTANKTSESALKAFLRNDVIKAWRDGNPIQPTTKEFGSENKLFKKPTPIKPGELQDITSLIAKATQYAGFFVEGGIRDFATFSKEMIASFGDKITPYLKDLFAEAMAKVDSPKTQSGPTSNKERQVDRERAARGKEPVGKPELPTLDEMNEAALADLKNDETLGSTLIADILSDPEPRISDRQNALMSMYRRQVMNARDKWAKKAGNGDVNAKREYDKQEAELERIDRAAALTRSQWGRWGVVQQQMINQDYSREAMERKARTVIGGALKQEQIKEIEERSEAIAEDQKELEQAEEKQKSNVIDVEFSEAYKQLQKRVEKRLKSQNRQRLHAEGKKNIEEGLKELNALGLFSNPLADPRTYKALMKVTKGYIQDFSADVQDFVAWVREQAKPEFNAAVTDEELIGVHTDTLMEMDQDAMKLVKKKRKKAKEKAKAKPPAKPKEVVGKIKDKKQKAEKRELIPVKPEEVVLEIETLHEAEDALDPRLIYKLAEAHILDGVHGEDAVMAAVTRDLEGLIPGITEHDVRLAFTQYGKQTIPSQEEHKKELREIRTLVRLQESIDRLKAGLDPLKTGLQRDKATQKIRERQKALNILMREHAKKNPVMSAEKLASVEQTRITRLENRIEDLEKQIRTGEKPAKRTEVDDSPEVTRLKAKIEILKKTLEQIELAKNPPISPEQKQINELAELRDHLDTVLRNREAAKSQKPFEPLTKRSADLKQEIDELRKAIATMRRQLKDPRTKAQKLEAAKIKALEEAIDLYDKRLANGDFSPLYDKKDVPVSDRVSALRKLRDARRKVYMAAKKASKPILTHEERVNRQRMAALQRRQAALQDRIARKDFSKKAPRKVVEDNSEVAKKRFELDQQIAGYNEMLANYRFDQMSWFKKQLTRTLKVLNLSRAVITAVDLSAALRQGGIAILAHPSMFKKGFMPMLRAFRSKQGAHKINTEIKGRKNAHLYDQSGLFIAEQNTTDVSKMEEVYMSALAERIPLIAGSSRAYVTFLNKLRADMFDMMLATLTADGHTHTKEEIEAIANYINVATGRGKIGFKSVLQLKENSQAGEHLAAIFFAPKYVASRFNFLLGQPLYSAPDNVRKMIAKEYSRYFAGISAVLGLAVMAAAAFRDDDEERDIISLDPRSSDFLKVKFGDTRIDLMSGLIQPTVFLTRIISGQTKSGRGDVKALRNWWRIPTDDLDKYDGVNYGSQTVWDVATTFGRSKLAPAPGLLINFMQGTNVVGQQVDPLLDSLAMFAPLSLRDFAGMIEENGVPGAIALQTFVTFGAGAQTYGDGGWSEQRGAIDRKIQEIKDEVTAEPTARARREKFNELQAEYPWLLSGANLDTYKRSNRETGRRRGDIKETGSGVKIKDMPEHVKGETTELIGDLNSAIRKLQKRTKLEDFADLADYSDTLKKALESGDVDTGMMRGMKIRKELEDSARQIKRENLSEIRRAKRAAKN